jgi:hypothetical protein
VVAAALAGCGGDTEPPGRPDVGDPRLFADAFVERLVSGESIEYGVTFEIEEELTRLQETLRRDGVRMVDGPGRLRTDCPENPALEAGRDCIVYSLSGSQTRPVAGAQPIQATLRLWVRPEDGGWVVSYYTYDARFPEEPR